MTDFIILEPNYENVARFQANAFRFNSFTPGAKEPITSFIHVIAHLTRTDPWAVNRILREIDPDHPGIIKEEEDGEEGAGTASASER